MCVRSPDDREERVTIAQDRKRSSQDHQHGRSKENVRKVASLQSVVSCGSYPLFFNISLLSLSLHSSLISIRTFNQNSIQLLRRRRRRKTK